MLKVEFTDKDFEFIRKTVLAEAGINLTDRKKELVYGRLWKRVRELGMEDFSSYCQLLGNPGHKELAYCINAITTNVTSFFREAHHFAFLENQFKIWNSQRLRGQRSNRIRIWSAGCSSGEEPYSIAMTLLDAGLDPRDWDLKILASDIDTQSLDKAKAGIYKRNRIEKMDAKYLRWLQCGTNKNEGLVRVHPRVQEFIRFESVNLFGSWTGIEDQFDIIFCRNVIIYFSSEDRQRLLNRFAERLATGSHLILGHSESTHGIDSSFQVIGHTINQRI